jgi:hypothetical protein
MKIEIAELSRGYSEELSKRANLQVVNSIPSGIRQINPQLASGASHTLAPAIANTAAHAAPALGKTVGKRLLSALPVVGNLASAGFAVNSAREGDWVGAGINALGAIPGVNTGVQLGALATDLFMPQSWRDSMNSAVTAPYRAYQAVKAIPGQVINFAKAALPIAGTALLAGMHKSPAQPGAAAPQKNRVMLTNNTEGVHSLGAPKMAGVTDALSDAVKRRVANNVLDGITSRGQSSPEPQAPTQQQQEAKKIELVSAYPEIAQMVENPQTKAYLERLLQTQA